MRLCDSLGAWHVTVCQCSLVRAAVFTSPQAEARVSLLRGHCVKCLERTIKRVSVCGCVLTVLGVLTLQALHKQACGRSAK